jgi:hypothetical protein
MAKTSTSFKKGEAKGRPKGTPNKLTKTVKETVMAAFEDLQNDPKANLIAWGKANPTPFYQIAAKLIPTEISAAVEISGIKSILIEPASKTSGK